MKKNLIVMAIAALVAAGPASAQFVAGQSCPRYGAPGSENRDRLGRPRGDTQASPGFSDGTGYGAKSGKRSGPQDGTGAKNTQKNRRGARR
jgi:hypothetical protein